MLLAYWKNNRQSVVQKIHQKFTPKMVGWFKMYDLKG
jgi:hypothetical protein